MQNKQSCASFSPIRTGIVLNFVGEFSSPLLRCPLLTLHIIQMRTPAASVPRWPEALGSVTELSPLELLKKKKKKPPFTTQLSQPGWVCVSPSIIYISFSMCSVLRAAPEDSLPFCSWLCSLLEAQGPLLQAPARVLWFLVIEILFPPKLQQQGSLSPQHLPYLCPLPKLPPPRSLCSTMLTCLPWGWKFFLTEDPN